MNFQDPGPDRNLGHLSMSALNIRKFRSYLRSVKGSFSVRIAAFFMALTVFMLAINTNWAQAQDEAVQAAQKIEQQSKPVTLTQAIDLALANNTQIKRALLNVKDADEQVRIAWSEVLPDVSTSASYTRNLEIPVNFVPAKFFDPNAPADKLVPLQFGTDNNWLGGMTAEQNLFSGEAFVGISTSTLYKAAQQENLRQTTQQIVTQTRRTYYQVLIAEEQVRLQEATIKRLEQNLKDNRARYKAGLLDEYNVTQVEVQLSNQRPQLTEARYNVKQAYRNLLLQIGLPVDLQIQVQGNLNTFNITAEEASDDANANIKKVDRMTPIAMKKSNKVMDQAMDLRGDLRVLNVQGQLKDKQIKAIKARFLPTLSATYSLQWTAAQPGTPNFFGAKDQRARYQTLGLNLRLPIFEGFERRANLQIAEIEKKDIQEQKYYAKRAAKNEIISAEESLQQAFETAAARRKALDQAQRGYNNARARLKRGVGSQLDVTNAELQLREAQLNYARMVYNYLTAKAQYDQAIGLVPFAKKANPEIK